MLRRLATAHSVSRDVFPRCSSSASSYCRGYFTPSTFSFASAVASQLLSRRALLGGATASPFTSLTASRRSYAADGGGAGGDGVAQKAKTTGQTAAQTASVAAAAATAVGARPAATTSSTTDGSETITGHTPESKAGESTTASPASSSSSGIRSIGIKLSEDDELVRAFNHFSKTVNGCTQEEFLMGATQAYASLAVLISAFLDHVQLPLQGRTESAKVMAAAQEANKFLAKEFQLGSGLEKPLATTSAAAATDGDGKLGRSEPIKSKSQRMLVQQLVSTITSVVPVSSRLAESIFKIWMLQREKKVNLSTLASPADYVLDSKLVIFARLDSPRVYFNSDSIGASVDVTISNEYLRKLDPRTLNAAAEEGGTGDGGSQGGEGKDGRMIEVLTDTTANGRRATSEEHLFVVNRKTRKLTQTSGSATLLSNKNSGNSSSGIADDSASATHDVAESKRGGTMSRVQVTCATPVHDATQAAAENKDDAAPIADTTARTTAAATEATDVEEDPDACSVSIRVNGGSIFPIPADARACALLTVDVVVPPERFANNFEWFYKRLVGYENEYERIAAARVFASNSPKSLGTLLDFAMRMVTGKSAEFMLNKSVGRMIGIPDDVSQTPPATRKLMCMYMDASCKWVLADLVTLAPVLETKLPKA